jgi:hypothetical protein
MAYKTLIPISFRGSRLEAGTEIEPTTEELANIADLLEVVGETPEPEEIETPEPALADMTAAQLKEKAAALGLSTSGSKADLVDRITLHLEAGVPEPEETEEDA